MAASNQNNQEQGQDGIGGGDKEKSSDTPSTSQDNSPEDKEFENASSEEELSTDDQKSATAKPSLTQVMLKKLLSLSNLQ